MNENRPVVADEPIELRNNWLKFKTIENLPIFILVELLTTLNTVFSGTY